MNKWLIGGLTLATILLYRRGAQARVIPSFSVVEGGTVSSPYGKLRGYRDDGSKIYHLGVDIKAPKGTLIRAVSEGVIEKIWDDGQVSGYGNFILIYHNDGTSSTYAHLDDFADIYEGMPVSKGTIIGFVGQTQSPRPEMATAPHLHLEILDRHTRHINPFTPPRLNPLSYLSEQNMLIG